MTQHSSLKSASVGARHRNVLKRHERIRVLQTNDQWGNRHSVYKLPKLKLIKLKLKKVKTEKEGEAQTEGAAIPQTPQEGSQKPAAKSSAEKTKAQ
ncbi:MAG: small basic protein [Candidatus Omnitrophica bacterium]|nr:small basic protein [Candidatus Omnitrophota bacterium]